MKEFDCEYMVDGMAALAEAQGKTKENVVVQEHSLVMIKWEIIPKIRKLRGLANHSWQGFKPQTRRRQLANNKEHGQAQHSYAITSCEVEVSLFPTHGMHYKHLWYEGMLQKITMNAFPIFQHPSVRPLSARSGNNSYQRHADTLIVKTCLPPSDHSASVHH